MTNEHSRVGCPFYGHAFISAFGALHATGGNQCALITSSHSPCWMDVGEHRSPDWSDCPRNPEWLTARFGTPDHQKRFREHHADLQELQCLRNPDGESRG